MKNSADPRVAIVGTGFSGIGMAIALKRAGIPFVILEKSKEFGGAWRDNVYPGVACDIPAHLYSFSFEPNPSWTKWWAPGEEIENYLLSVVEKHDLKKYVHFNSTVKNAVWDENLCLWHIHTDDGREYVAEFIISGVGALHIPSVPDIEGLDTFEGSQFHSAEWDTSCSLKDKRVAVVGTGASAIQIVPAILDEVSELKLYQRTPAWVVPRENNEIPGLLRTAFKWIPGARLSARFGIHLYQEFIGEGMTRHQSLLKVIELLARYNLRKGIPDPVLRERLTPQYPVGCKRVLAKSDYYPAIADPKTTLVTDRIARVTPKGVVSVDADGNESEEIVDVIVWATGFHVADSYKYVDIVGANGVDLVELWNKTGTIAHRGVTVAGFPNMFFLLGPNTGLGHNSVVIMIEAQIKYVMQAIKAVDRRSAWSIVPKQDAQDAYNDWLQGRMPRTVQAAGNCQSWYIDEHGYNRTLFPGHTGEYREVVAKLKEEEFDFF